MLEDAESTAVWHRLRKMPGARIGNPDDGPNGCDGRCCPVTVEGSIDAAIVLPEVAGYSPVQIERIAAVCLRDSLGIGDGDSLRLDVP